LYDGIRIENYWRKKFPACKFDNSRVPLYKVASRSRLIVCTYNGTTFIESLDANIPTLIFWDPLIWEITESCQREFGLLEKAGIYHKSAESAAMYMCAIWYDIKKWWESAVVQYARTEFCNRFSSSTNRKADNMVQVLKKILEDSETKKGE